MKSYWINIDECLGRKEFMINQFKNIKCIESNKRISAITCDNIDMYVDDKDLPYKCDPSNNFFKGCKNCKIEFCTLLSHMKAIEEGYKDGDEWFIIFEDDTVIKHEIDWIKLFETIPKDAEVLQLFVNMGPTVEKLFEIYKKNALWIPWQMILPSASGYLMSHIGAKRMIDTYKKTNKWCFSKSTSCRLADVLTYETCKTYTHTYPVFHSNIKFGSLIHPDHLAGHEQANNIIKNIIQQNHQNHKFLKIINF